MKYIRNTTDFYIEENTVLSLGKFDGILLSVLLQLSVPVCVLPAVCVSPLLQILSQQLFHFLSLL